MRNSENLYDYSQNLNPGGYSGFQQVTGMIEGFFWVGKFGKYFLGFSSLEIFRAQKFGMAFFGFCWRP